MRKSLLDKVNYEDCKLAEDWYLWLRIINSNEFKFDNIPIPTVLVNVSNYSRLSGFSRFKIEYQFFNKFYKENLINAFQFSFNIFVSFFSKFIFSKFIKLIYKNFLRIKFNE